MRRPWLLPLGPLYAAGLRVADRVRPAQHSLARPVISVGSLSAGGAGKTPVVRMLAELLGRNGIGADVLSRGYGRSNKNVMEVDPHGSAREFGDEPMELARAGIAVWVGANRHEAGLAAESAVFKGTEHARIHLLDDGFQHRRLARALEIVLLTAEDAEDRLLPMGNLREPFSALRRADVIIVREQEAERLRPLIARHSKADVWLIRREIYLPDPHPLRPVVFCGIARPQDLLAMLKEQGCEVAGEMLFPDHHPYTELDARALLKRARDTHADGFLTTSKDDVKLRAEICSVLKQAGLVTVVALRSTLVDEQKALDRILPLVQKTGATGCG